MKILYVHNSYHQLSGEEHASKEIASLLEENGHQVLWFTRTTLGQDNIKGKLKAFFCGIINPFIKNRFEEVINVYNPDIVLVQNIYPYISSAIFKIAKRHRKAVVMRCPNYRLFCPSGLCLSPKGNVCEKCWTGLHEFHCVLNNCENNNLKSIGYALRNAYNRISGNILNNVDCFIVQSEFQRQKFVDQGIPNNHIGILPGILPTIKIEDKPLGEFVTFVGRVSQEKGINEFVEAARQLPKIPFRVVGKIDENYIIPKNIPSNIDFVGFKKGDDLNEMYFNSRIVVIPSKWYEGFPNVILHAMLLKRPVITTRIGAMMNIVDDHINGLLVNPADTISLKNAIEELYFDISKCHEYGVRGYAKATTVYSRKEIYHALMGIFSKAINNNK